MANLLLSLLSVAAWQARLRFKQKIRHVASVQETFLQTLLRHHQGTAFGQDYGLADIKTVDQFRERIPVLPYSCYEPYIERIANGEANVLNPDPVVYLNLTSGTTGKQKLVPVTDRSRRILDRANQVSMGFAIQAAHRHGRRIGKMLLTSSVQLLGHTAGGIPYGPVSAGNLRLLGSFYQQIFAHPFEALKPADTLARHYVCLLFALRDPSLAVIGANFPVLALRLCDYLETYAEDLVQDLATGTIAPWLNLEPELRTTLERQLSPAPKRAAQLRHTLKTAGRLTPQLAWPNLSFLTTARGGSSDFYFQRFPDYFGNTPIFGGIYSSSEATFGLYNDFNTDGTVLSIESAFFEFVPEDQWHLTQPKTVLAEEVKVGELYRILVTNYSGFYRYDIGDVVEVVGFYERAPLITFRHRLGGLLSSTTEKTTEFHVVQVMQRLQHEFGVALENFCVTLSEQNVPPHYLVNIERVPDQHPVDWAAFIEQFDRHLQEIHVSYANKRIDRQIPPPRLRILASGSYAILRQRLLQRGTHESQLKFPHINEDRHFLSGLTVEREVRSPEDNGYAKPIRALEQ
ncbi:GH3 auxin-responsive promoter family protein [Oculatella sp. LEGE 06141]|uniref:GH3 auxin-responsive promoter family protein n=1 Tax=Oculatella sp. LEGE 06141 TaxID=1828648 RepID=UPI001882C0B3|nr:GH3 auxin-responsive promoter family protein [Oculatella sp. LEGE 06141]MBE9178281.1 GH3 auxin-responsive promoter family protein [Oculatella sp. LEGE 06141]